MARGEFKGKLFSWTRGFAEHDDDDDDGAAAAATAARKQTLQC